MKNKNIKNTNNIWVTKRFMSFVAILFFLIVSCSEDFLDFKPRGTVTAEQVSTVERIDQMVIAAYASLGNEDREENLGLLWPWGTLRSDDAYKGGGGVNNRTEWHEFETFSILRVDNPYLNGMWVTVYEGIGRANDALRKMEHIPVEEYPLKLVRQAELRFIRGHFHFLLKEIFKYPVWADDSTPKFELKNVSNRELTNDELWNKIADDFEFAVANLPLTQPEIGRANKVAAWAYLAKVRLYQAYEQDEQNNVININSARLNEVVALTDNVINSGLYGLHDDFGKNFLYEYENGIESIFAVQFSIDDGVQFGRTNRSSMMNFPMNPEYGCCWFGPPSLNLVNAFKTSAEGLPMFNTYNDDVITDFQANTVDPRLDHTVGIPYHPFKYIPDFVYQPNWARVPEVYGPYSTMKEVDKPDCPCLTKVGAYVGSSKNIDILRYDDVLLMKAEALIELAREDEALPLINQIRIRAENSTEWLKHTDGSYASKYHIEPYIDGVNSTWTQDFAREALRWERRLEFAMEGYRFFDLVRWGIAAETLNAYFAVEATRLEFLSAANFTKGRDEYMPIPQSQINLVEGLYQQNNGWSGN